MTWLRSIPLLALLALACTGPGPGTADPDSEFAEATRDYLGRLEKLGFAGTVLVARDGRPILDQAYGFADRESGVRWTPETVSTVGSITKQFTAAAILTLEEQGRLSVDDPITTYFDEVPPDKRDITIHQLLTHSSGIVDLDGLDDWDPIERLEFVRRAMDQEPAFEPGTSYAYSNAGYSLLGAIIEQLTGDSYERYVRERLFVPNGMERTGYILADWDERDVATGYAGGVRWGTVLGRPIAADGPYWVLRANGGIHSSSSDMLRWAEALTAGRVLSPASMAKLWAPHVDEGFGDSHYGYGWVVTTGPGDRRVITHNGGNGIFFADLAILPDDGVVMFLETNVAADMPVSDALLERMLDRLFADDPYPEVPDRIAIDAGEVAAHAGTYRLNETAALRVTADGDAIVVEPEGREAFAILHSRRPIDAERVDRLSARIDRVVAELLAGNFAPLGEAYGDRATEQRLRESWSETFAELESEHGSLRSHEVLGTALRDGRDVTVVRFLFERGHFDRAYVWNLDDEPELLGVSVRGLDPQLRFVATGALEFASWDGGISESRSLRFEPDDGGRGRLRFGDDGAAVWIMVPALPPS